MIEVGAGVIHNMPTDGKNILDNQEARVAGGLPALPHSAAMRLMEEERGIWFNVVSFVLYTYMLRLSSLVILRIQQRMAW